MTKLKNLSLKKVVFYLVLTVVIFYLLFPFYWAVNTSFKSEAQLSMTPATFLPVDPETGEVSFYLRNYEAVFEDDQFMRGLLNSTIVAGFTTLLALLVGSFAAFALGKLRFKGKRPSLYVILAMTMFPQVTVLSGLYAVINYLNLDAILSMILSYMLFTLPFTTWVMTAFFKDLPIEIMQSAQVDGATPFQTFRMILLPLTAPALVTTGLLSFIAAWNEYLFALTFTSIDVKARTVPVAIQYFAGNFARQEPFGERMAAAVIVTIPIVILVLIFQRKIVQGLTAGAVKG
ncbi:carbohydrate ABC transporter permease [Halothermothrix orenii]|uniref:Binding-protein-dependent transport systems inner membrane component n=1 Tax=Halothermothrix orenii (strain H 168 / OCM 544 / DSM 9562) TaxID=373903 RepID=B8CZX8_HALOH|nr:carbohydrate ABC transporter permease [Halothermothrix orenii]ACL70830.1 binding-protein-dependent transport systems inner membrane component [Halothermothrix orenii H 168]